jgi:hypothetical protein
MKSNGKYSKNQKIQSYKSEVLKSENLDKKLLSIWKINPSYKDIHLNMALIKAAILVLLTLFFIISTYIISLNLFTSIGIGAVTMIIFIVSFHDDFYHLDNFSLLKLRNFASFDPFENILFWKIKNASDSVFFTNKKDLMNVGMRIFKIETIAQNIRPTLNQFIKSLSKLRIPYSYQIIQTPLYKEPNDATDLKNGQQLVNSLKSFQTSIYYCVYYYVKGILNDQKISMLQQKLNTYTNSINSSFKANFHHHRIKLLSDIDLINGLRTLITMKGDAPPIEPQNSEILKNIELTQILKTLTITFILAYFTYLLNLFSISVSLIILMDCAIVLIVLLIWWKDLLFYITKINTKHLDLVKINPFKGINYYRYNEIPDSIFLYINKKLLIDIKIFNLRYVAPGQWNFPDKFFRSVMSQGIPFTYTTIMAPIGIDAFNKECFSYLKEKIKTDLLKNFSSPIESEDWLTWRSGIWRTILNLSVASYKFIPFLDKYHFHEIEEELKPRAETLYNAFQMNYPNFKLIELDNRKLISGYLSIILKHKFFRFNGTHLNYILFQGKSLIKLTTIVNELKKGIETRIPAEFNTPLRLKNFINIGHTINTEFLEQEIPLGFTYDQLRNLLITNGTWENTQALAMKIVFELVKAKAPSIIFDFSGSWSKLIHLFEGTQYEDDFLSLKLGSAFNLNLLNSDIPYDTNNVDYLNYVFEVYALCYKKDDNTMENLKNTLLKTPEINLPALALGVQNKQNWEKDYGADSLIALFNEFSQRTISFIHTPSNEMNDITIQDFIEDDKTVIIDLTILKDFKLQVFATFIILSKITHYIKNKESYCKKIMLIPGIDLIFDNFYLNRNTNYWRIDRFLAPLLDSGFGLIFLANEIRNLHPNLFNFFRNFITFKVTNDLNIKLIKKIMNLDEAHGTGYYSNKRNNTYQLEFLSSMKDNEILVKRSDIIQPFPGLIELNDIKQTKTLNYERVIDYMDKQGYDLKNTEKRILEQTKKTLFEKDLGDNSIFLEEIIRFLKALKTVDQVGNLYRTKIKEELKKIIYPKASKITKNKRKLFKIREDLFLILVKHGYLIENHPKRASGSESIRTSYSVGPKYQKALEDYFKTKKTTTPTIKIEPIENSSGQKEDFTPLFRENSNEDIINEIEFKETLTKETGSFLLYNLYKMNNFITNSHFKEALSIGKDFVVKFLINLYTKVFEHNTDTEITDKDILASVNYLADNKKIPFNKNEILKLLDQTQSSDKEEDNLELRAKDIYDLLSNFSLKIQRQLIEG